MEDRLVLVDIGKTSHCLEKEVVRVVVVYLRDLPDDQVARTGLRSEDMGDIGREADGLTLAHDDLLARLDDMFDAVHEDMNVRVELLARRAVGVP